MLFHVSVILVVYQLVVLAVCFRLNVLSNVNQLSGPHD